MPEVAVADAMQMVAVRQAVVEHADDMPTYGRAQFVLVRHFLGDG